MVDGDKVGLDIALNKHCNFPNAGNSIKIRLFRVKIALLVLISKGYFAFNPRISEYEHALCTSKKVQFVGEKSLQLYRMMNAV
jgi:hypothetical protein